MKSGRTDFNTSKNPVFVNQLGDVRRFLTCSLIIYKVNFVLLPPPLIHHNR